MARRQPPDTSGIPTPTETDDFKLIEGIGAGFEKRLHKAGILTYQQLADLSPDQVAGFIGKIAGLSPERIGEQDWIGQARELVGHDTSAEIETSPALEGRRLYASFIVKLRLDDTGQVRGTTVEDIQSKHEESWGGWQEDRLLGFITQRVQLPRAIQRPGAGNIPERVEVAPVSTGVSAETAPGPSVLRVTAAPVALSRNMPAEESSGIQIGPPRSPNFVNQGEPFHVRLRLDLSEMGLPAGSNYDYTATVYARQIGGGLQILGKSEGSLPSSSEAVILIEGKALPSGFYRFDGLVTLDLQAADLVLGQKHRAFVQSGLIQVA